MRRAYPPEHRRACADRIVRLFDRLELIVSEYVGEDVRRADVLRRTHSKTTEQWAELKRLDTRIHDANGLLGGLHGDTRLARAHIHELVTSAEAALERVEVEDNGEAEHILKLVLAKHEPQSNAPKEAS